jgi:hypothetical protein
LLMILRWVAGFWARARRPENGPAVQRTASVMVSKRRIRRTMMRHFSRGDNGSLVTAP